MEKQAAEEYRPYAEAFAITVKELIDRVRKQDSFGQEFEATQGKAVTNYVTVAEYLLLSVICRLPVGLEVAQAYARVRNINVTVWKMHGDQLATGVAKYYWTYEGDKSEDKQEIHIVFYPYLRQYKDSHGVTRLAEKSDGHFFRVFMRPSTDSVAYNHYYLHHTRISRTALWPLWMKGYGRCHLMPYLRVPVERPYTVFYPGQSVIYMREVVSSSPANLEFGCDLLPDIMCLFAVCQKSINPTNKEEKSYAIDVGRLVMIVYVLGTADTHEYNLDSFSHSSHIYFVVADVKGHVLVISSRDMVDVYDRHWFNKRPDFTSDHRLISRPFKHFLRNTLNVEELVEQLVALHNLWETALPRSRVEQEAWSIDEEYAASGINRDYLLELRKGMVTIPPRQFAHKYTINCRQVSHGISACFLLL